MQPAGRSFYGIPAGETLLVTVTVTGPGNHSVSLVRLPHALCAQPLTTAGFTLIEMIIVIAITAIIGSMVALFLRAPLESYVAQDRRARLADTADTALRRMGRDIRLALPNSVRVTSVRPAWSTWSFSAPAAAGAIAPRAAATSSISPWPTTVSTCSARPSRCRPATASPCTTSAFPAPTPGRAHTLAAYAGATGSVTNIAIAAKQFPLASPGNRFQVVEGPVSYVRANPANPPARSRATGAMPSRRPAHAVPLPASSALLATGVSACNFTYQPGVTERGGLVSMTLNLSQANETVRLYATTQVSNQP